MLPDELFLGIHMYGIMIALGLLGTFVVLFTYSKKKNINSKFVDFVFYNAIISIIVGFLAAALFQALYNYIEDPSQGFRFGSGITFIGGLIGGAGCFLIIYFSFRKKLTGKLLDILPVIPCCILIAHAFGRVGCFFAGCCHGVETESAFGMEFPNLPNPVYPTQLYEAIFLFIMFAVCSFLVLKFNYRHNMAIYLITYGIFRFLIEFLRGDSRGAFLGVISPSQFWSILMVVVGIGCIVLIEYLHRKSPDKIITKKETKEEKSE